ncbi:hypothetical protein MKW98_008866 [Papaver atlanticum]|uniref:3-beta hydroxysteroid dehydrogenase/isomerase domain-containing protein n=1 Tax=Papaver atlanticum TaxID=357466 RepID=A0AAD4T718_9MAGN|nr:hypothetical protein MKW98_008866 [Papaver atlanticum]
MEISLQEVESLHLFQIDLIDYDSVFSSINGTVGVFHLASPCIVDTVDDPQAIVGSCSKGNDECTQSSKGMWSKMSCANFIDFGY